MPITHPRGLRARLATVVALLLAVTGLTYVAAGTASAASVGYKGPYYGQAAGTTAGSVPGSPTAQKPQSKLWFAHGSWWGALWNETSTNTGEAFTVQRYDWGANQWVDTGVKLETRARSDLDVLWAGGHLYVASNSDAANAPASVDVSRYAYSGGTWTFEWTAHVADAYVYSPVIERDSTGMLWMTYTQGDKVMVTHSVVGNEQSWVAPYVLPTPGGESTVSYNSTSDPNQPSSDIASIVNFDGNKIGVLWSNQRTDTVYWASHNDGALETAWSTEVAFTAPEGADDHISLKSVVGTDGGRVYAVTKTSMNGAEPIFEVLVLRLNGEWDNFAYASASTNLTRPIIVLDTDNRELYVFAAAGESANSGGLIYYKKTSMTSPDFGSLDSRGTVFISDDALTADANTERINNPSSTKQNVNAATGMLVVANNDPTDYYYYNRLTLAAPADTTAPDTTITSGPAASTTETTATFSFTSNEAGSTFECSLDAGTYAACTSPKSYTGLAVGSHTFTVRAKDAAGNTDATPASYTWSVTAAPDTTAPETTITSGPAASTAETTAAFSFTSSEAGSTFECKLDTGAYAACTSPKSYTGLTVGAHTFTVRAKDAAGNTDATPATHAWTVTTSGGGGGGGGGGDTTPPETTITSGPAASTTATTADFGFTASEAGSTFECQLDGGAYASCVSPKSYTGLAVGAHTFSVRAKDAAGNTDGTPATHAWTVAPPADTTAPETTITDGPPSSTTATTATFSFTSSEAGSTFSCKLDSGAYKACTSPQSYTGLTATRHKFWVRATDAAGNTDETPAERTWRVQASSREQVQLFADDFSSQGFAAGGWRVRTTGDGSAYVWAGAVRDGDPGAWLKSTGHRGSGAALTKTLASKQRTLRIEWDALVTREARDGQRSALLRVRNVKGRVVLSVSRVAGTGRLQIRELGGAVTTTRRLPLGRVVRLELSVRQRADGRDSWRLVANGVTASSDQRADTGSRALRGMTFGSTNAGKRLVYRIDDVEVWVP